MAQICLAFWALLFDVTLERGARSGQESSVSNPVPMELEIIGLVPRQTAVGPTLAGEIMMRYCQQHYLGEKFDQPYLCSHGVLGVEEKHSNVQP